MIVNSVDSHSVVWLFRVTDTVLIAVELHSVHDYTCVDAETAVLKSIRLTTSNPAAAALAARPVNVIRQQPVWYACPNIYILSVCLIMTLFARDDVDVELQLFSVALQLVWYVTRSVDCFDYTVRSSSVAKFSEVFHVSEICFYCCRFRLWRTCIAASSVIPALRRRTNTSV